MRESIFGSIVSGPVQIPEFGNKDAILANTLPILSSSTTEDLISKL